MLTPLKGIQGTRTKKRGGWLFNPTWILDQICRLFGLGAHLDLYREWFATFLLHVSCSFFSSDDDTGRRRRKCATVERMLNLNSGCHSARAICKSPLTHQSTSSSSSQPSPIYHGAWNYKIGNHEKGKRRTEEAELCCFRCKNMYILLTFLVSFKPIHCEDSRMVSWCCFLSFLPLF